MIIHLKETVNTELAAQLAKQAQAQYFIREGQTILITSSSNKELPDFLREYTAEHFAMASDIQLASRTYQPATREVTINPGTSPAVATVEQAVKIGGSTNNTLMITGPCSIESWEQIVTCADMLKELGITTLRAGCFKPRTSPYSFQGLGMEGLKMLAQIREEYGFNIITEVRDATHVEAVIEHADIVQIGAKAMYDHGILRTCGEARKPVLLKRHFGATLQELVQAAEFVLSGGNEQVMLCERGIRTFETKTRFTLDLCGVSYLKEHINLPIILDTSHAMGYAYGVPDLTRACVAMGVDGLLIESHPNPKVAKSDAAQQLNLDEFRSLYRSVQSVAEAVGRKVV
ncbi:3-deoxy-7-phosphoheptulonate synthase [Tunicatimonas pelagia]|uniref:3-deoxy-7-phosphoheptulonate synthase n=1 Tax=Tunicatimonas pelagia TaxID=931531 RepID=UPI0026666450|nr:3-deoxy-7-phosphoheptulonate synthase [Tunicatimonas pelagia]WKN44739.1 3-deoxy-7-phosphoheptulonate synthase [Tunicatimonas pelagia]